MKKRKRRCKKKSSRGRVREITFGEVSGRSGRFKPVYVDLDKLFILRFLINKGPRTI
jgi:hypothetical protein